MGKRGTPKKTDWQEGFLVALAAIGVVKFACKAANVSRNTAYREREREQEFAASWDAAVEESTDVLEQEAFRRACQGTAKPIFHQGKKIATIREYSDTLLIFLLKSRRPHIYRDMTADQLAAATAARAGAKVEQGIPIEHAVEFNQWLAAKQAGQQSSGGVGGDEVSVVPAAGSAEPGVSVAG